MNSSKIITNFERYIHNHFFKVMNNVRKIPLKEEKGDGYQIQLNVSRAENSFLLIKNLEELKQQYAHYLKEPPKDCDYVILDLYEKNIFFIELKDTKFTNMTVMKQLNAGQKWLEHLIFCCGCHDSLVDWKTFKIGARYMKSRPSKSKRVNQSGRGDLTGLNNVSGDRLIIFKGQTVNIDAFVN